MAAQFLTKQNYTVMDTICKALMDLSDDYIRFLTECFSEEDFEKLHFKEVINNLVTFENKIMTKYKNS